MGCPQKKEKRMALLGWTNMQISPTTSSQEELLRHETVNQRRKYKICEQCELSQWALSSRILHPGWQHQRRRTSLQKWMSCVCEDCGPNHKFHDSCQGQNIKYITISASLQSKKKKGQVLWINLSHLLDDSYFDSLKAPVKTFCWN